MRDLKNAIKLSLPVLGAYWFLGLTYGLLAANMDYPIWVSLSMALVVYSAYALTTSDKSKLETRKEALRQIFRSKAIFVVFVTSSGLVENDYTRDNVNGVIVLPVP